MLQKAKGPATAVGAALLGAAGMAAARGGKKRSGLLGKAHLPKPSSLNMPKPNLKKTMKGVSLPKLDDKSIDWVEEKAKGMGDAGYRVAEMTSQARRVKKAISGD